MTATTRRFPVPQTETEQPFRPLIYDIQLTRNPQGTWIAVFGEGIYGKPAASLTEALTTLAVRLELHRELADLVRLELHRELADLLLSRVGIASMLTRNTDREEAVK